MEDVTAVANGAVTEGREGAIGMTGLLEPTSEAPSDTGARMRENPDPTIIELLPAVGSTSGGGDEEEQPGPPRGPGNNNGHGPGNGNGNGPDTATGRVRGPSVRGTRCSGAESSGPLSR